MTKLSFEKVKESILNALCDGAYLATLSSEYDLTVEEVELAYSHAEEARCLKDFIGKDSLLDRVADDAING